MTNEDVVAVSLRILAKAYNWRPSVFVYAKRARGRGGLVYIDRTAPGDIHIESTLTGAGFPLHNNNNNNNNNNNPPQRKPNLLRT